MKASLYLIEESKPEMLSREAQFAEGKARVDCSRAQGSEQSQVTFGSDKMWEVENVQRMSKELKST